MPDITTSYGRVSGLLGFFGKFNVINVILQQTFIHVGFVVLGYKNTLLISIKITIIYSLFNSSLHDDRSAQTNSI